VRLLVVLRTTAPWPAIQARGAEPPGTPRTRHRGRSEPWPLRSAPPRRVMLLADPSGQLRRGPRYKPGGPSPNVASLCLFVQREDAGHAGCEVCRCRWGSEAPGHPPGKHRTRNSVQPPVILADQPAIS